MLVHEVDYFENCRYDFEAYENNKGELIYGSNPKVTFHGYYRKPVNLNDLKIESFGELYYGKRKVKLYKIGDLFYRYERRPFIDLDKVESFGETIVWNFAYGDKICKCNECGKYYIISFEESLWFEDKGLKPPTTRCKKCRIKGRKK